MKNNIRSFLENFVRIYPNDQPAQKVYQHATCSKQNRFTSFLERKKYNIKRFDEYAIIFSQGTHSVNMWKGSKLFKSIFDLGIYSNLIQEIKPQTIIEFGSGEGSSAIWFSDLCDSLNIQTKVVSYDINPVVVDPKENVHFIKQDLYEPLQQMGLWEGRKLFIEDSHVNLLGILEQCESVMQSGDYIMIEDNLGEKEKYVDYHFSLNNNQYLVDNYYIDYYGPNMSSFGEGIFKFK